MKFLSWDWKASVDVDELKAAIESFPGPVSIHEVNTESDFTLIVVYERGMNLPNDKSLITLWHNSLD